MIRDTGTDIYSTPSYIVRTRERPSNIYAEQEIHQSASLSAIGLDMFAAYATARLHTSRMAIGSGRQRIRFSRSEVPSASHASDDSLMGL